MQKIKEFFDNNKTPFFSLEANGEKIANNSGDTDVTEFSDASVLLDNALKYVAEGAKVTIKTYPTAKGYNGALSFTWYNTVDGLAPAKGSTPVSGGSMAGMMEVFMTGFKMGEERGALSAKLDQIAKQLNDRDESNDSQAKLDLNKVVEGLTSTDFGQQLLGKLLNKFGILE